METRIDAIYENGVFRPLDVVTLPDHLRVVLTVENHAAATVVADAVTRQKRAAAELDADLADASGQLPGRRPVRGRPRSDSVRRRTMIFVDTSAWFARYSPKDAHHAAAKRFDAESHDEFVTTDYVIDELLTLLKVRAGADRAAHVGKALFEGALARVEWVIKSDVESAWAVFDSHRDKQWSFTDCVSLVVMRRLAIDKAFAFDEHFRQFGTVVVAP